MGARAAQSLAVGSALALPAGEAYRLSAVSADLELLEVMLPG